MAGLTDMSTNQGRTSVMLSARCFPGQDARDLPLIFATAVHMLEQVGANYAVIGRLGRARYCKAQWTDMIEFLVEPQDETSSFVSSVIKMSNDLRSATSTVKIHFLTAYSLADLRYLGLSTSATWFWVPARMATIEHLLQLALSSALHSGPAAIDLINSGEIDWTVFDAVSALSDTRTINKLASIRRQAARESRASYSSNVSLRLAQRLQTTPCPTGTCS